METVIKAQNLRRNYKTHKKEEGLKGSFKALFKREYKTIEAVKDVNFEIGQGELVGFIGPNGAGKTTTLKMLSGILFPTSGNVKVLGYTPHDRKNDFLKKISFVMGQKSQLWIDLPANETFRLNKEIYDVPDNQYKETIKELTEMLDVKDAIHQQVRKLSLGQRMKCELIAALIHQPKVLFLDEPTIGLDVVMQKKVREFVKQYNKKYQATVILTSHYMDDVKEICQRIVMINEGTLVFDGLINDLIQKHANHKTIVPVFYSKVSKEELGKYGEVVEFEYPKASIKVPRGETSKIATELLQRYDIDDLDINEPRLEDIIREAFETKLYENGESNENK